MDVFYKGWKWVEHNPYVTICVIVALAAVGGLVGCKATTGSLLGEPGQPAQQVTRPAFERDVIKVGQQFSARKVALQAEIATLNTEIAAANANIESGRAHLDSQDEFRAGIVQFVGGALADAADGNVNVGGLVTSGLLLLTAGAGIGRAADNARKDAKIKEMKADSVASTPA